MASKDKEKSLLEIAIELLESKKKPQKIMAILKEVMEIKGVKASLQKELAPQFLLDFMQSGYFVYCGEDCWDLKDRQPISVLDKDGGDYEYKSEEDVIAEKEQLRDDDYSDIVSTDDNEEEDDNDKDEQDDVDDDLAKAFEEFDDEFNGGLVLVPEEGEETDEDEE